VSGQLLLQLQARTYKVTSPEDQLSRPTREARETEPEMKQNLEELILIGQTITMVLILVHLGTYLTLDSYRLTKLGDKVLDMARAASSARIEHKEELKVRLNQQYSILISQFKELTKAIQLKSPYPVEMKGGLVEGQEEFATICRIVHWNFNGLTEVIQLLFLRAASFAQRTYRGH